MNGDSTDHSNDHENRSNGKKHAHLRIAVFLRYPAPGALGLKTGSGSDVRVRTPDKLHAVRRAG